jgi:hypothetical protein
MFNITNRKSTTDDNLQEVLITAHTHNLSTCDPTLISSSHILLVFQEMFPHTKSPACITCLPIMTTNSNHISLKFELDYMSLSFQIYFTSIIYFTVLVHWPISGRRTKWIQPHSAPQYYFILLKCRHFP